jgi:CRISPR-associated RAMP protein (TIGR02581 family)
MFGALRNRYVVKGKIELCGPLAISTGEADAMTDLPVMKTIDGIPFIPGSSFRGALRSLVERMLFGLGEKRVCLLGANPDPKIQDCNKELAQKVAKKAEEPNISERDLLDLVMRELCPTCLLFGSTTLASRLKVSDLPFIHNGLQAAPVTLRHRVGIDRDTDTARTGAKFDMEVVERGAFQMELILENANPEDWGILGFGLMELMRGDFWIGGDRSIGAGRCTLTEPRIYYFGDKGHSLKDYLVNGYRCMDSKESWSYILDHVTAFIQKGKEETNAPSEGKSM